MRGLAEQLGVAVTSIYWHIGGRDKLFDSLVDRLLGQMAHLPVDGDSAVDRIASLARSQRTHADRTPAPSRHRARAGPNAVAVPA